MYNKKNYKKNYKKSVKKYRKKTGGNKKLISLIKKVSLKKTETKHTHRISENNQLYHNVPFIYGSASVGMLYTIQSTANDDGGTSSYAGRLGDEVVARGISIKYWLSNKLDRPNVIYKLVVYRYQSKSTIVASNIWAQSNNYIINDYNVEDVKVIKTKIIRISNNTNQVTAATNHECSKFGNIWIPLKNRVIQYNNGGNVPKNYDYGLAIVAYDSYGTLTTDNIASFAWNYKFYFKDP